MEILIIFILTLLNGFFALSEIAMVSAKRSRIEQKASLGNKNAQIVLKLLQHPENFLSSVQVGITLIGIVAGAYGSRALVDDVRPYFENIPFLAPAADTLSIVLIIGAITYFSIVIGELIPKTIAINNAEKIALAVAPVIKYFTMVTYPLVKLLSGSTKLVLKVLRIKDPGEEKMSEDELRQILKTAGKTGVLKQDVSEMHQNIFLLSNQRARNLKTHRTEVEWFDLSQPLDEIYLRIKQSTHSKFPVCQNSIDNVVGYFRSREFFELQQEPGFTLKSILQEPVFISETMFAFNILKLFKAHKQYLAVVVDEFGSFEGIITLHDIMEAIVGDLPDMDESTEPEILERADKSWLINGATPIHQLNTFAGHEIIIEKPEDYTTLAGFIIFHLNHIPKTEETFIFNGYRFEIIDLDGHRIDKVIMKTLPEEPEPEGA